MARKVRTVFTADAEQLTKVERLVRSGEFASTSAFLRAAIEDKLRRLEAAVMAEQLDRACDLAGEGDDELVHAQAWDD